MNFEKWTKHRKELLETRSNLQEFLKSRSVNIMVPVGKKALVRGTLQHTNEITVSHGASMFSDLSTSQAVDILDHRIKSCDERLTALEMEKNLFVNRIKLPEDVFSQSESREIIEEYHEGEEKAWRAKHRESLKRQKQKEAEERQQQQDNVDVFQKLDEYEMMEELAEELESLDIEDDELLSKLLSGKVPIPPSKQRVAHNLVSPSIVKESIDNENSLTCSPKSVPDLSSEASSSQDLITQNNHEIVDLLKTYRSKIKDVLKNVRKDDERNLNLFLDLIELKDDIEDDIRKMNDDEEEEDYSSDASEEKDSDDETASIEIKPGDTKRKVRFSKSLEDVKLIESKSELYDNVNSENHTIQINFKHSDAKFTCSKLPGDDTILHPGEIHQKPSPTPSTPPATKSILKNKRKVPESLAVDDKPVKKIFHSDLSVIGDVFEHEVIEEEEVVHITNKNNDMPKKLSKFKQMRLKA